MLRTSVPGFGHRAVFEAALPFLQPDQLLVVSSHSSLGALYLSRRGVRAGVAPLGTTVATAPRQTGPAAVFVNNVRRAVDVAALPAGRTPEATAAGVADPRSTRDVIASMSTAW